MNSVVLINGKKQTRLSVFNRLTQFGDGLFETCLVEKNRLLLGDKHFSRLEKGCAKLHIAPVARSLWLADISKAVALSKLDSAVVKIMLSRGESARGYGYDKNSNPTRIVIVSLLSELPDIYPLSICANGYASHQLLSGIKHCNRLEQILARSNMKTPECIMLDEHDRVISVTQGNIFAVRGQTVLTPSLEKCGIKGTTRALVFDLARELGLDVEVCSFSLATLLEMDEVFITNSVIGIKPVSSIGDAAFSQHDITNRLSDMRSNWVKKSSHATHLKTKKISFKWVAVFVFMAVFVWSFWANNIKANQAHVYRLPSGAGVFSTAQDLENRGLIHSKSFFVLAAKILNLTSSIKSGYYDIHTDKSVIDLLYDFSLAKVAVRNVTLVEGKTVQQYYQQLSTAQALTSQHSLHEIMRLIAAQQPYEGYFWPDTYQVNYADSVLSVFTRANKTLHQKLEKFWQGRAKNHPLNNANQALVLASLIEKETAHAAEKAKIAGVFMHRLKKGMRLQTDPTVVYALGEKYQGTLSKNDLRFESSYNTYRHKGLPPGPIGSVGVDSLYAAMHPQTTDALYFVAKKDGTHAFAKTYKQHQDNIHQYLKNL